MKENLLIRGGIGLKKFFVFFLLGLLLTTLCGCSLQEKEEETKETSQRVDIFKIAFNSFLDLDKGLNSQMEYIAIDFSPKNDITAEEKEKIMKYLESNDVPVLEATLEELQKQEEMYDEETRALKGILMKITEFTIKENEAIIKGSKYRSGKGAIGVECSLIKEGETWKIKESNITWIS